MNRDFETLRAEQKTSAAFDEETAAWDAAAAPITDDPAALRARRAS